MTKSKNKKQRVPKTPTQKLLGSIDIFEQTLVASVYDGESVTRKIIEPSDVVEVFLNTGIRHNSDSAVQWLDFGPGAIRTGLCRNGDLRVIVVRRPCRTTLRMQIGRQAPQRLCVVLPSLLAELVYRGGRWATVERVFAFWGRLTKRTALYLPPVPNVSSGGEVCMGGAQSSAADQPDAGVYFEQAFLNTTFTDHHIDVPLNAAAKKFRNVWRLLKQTRGRNIRKWLKKEGTYGNLFA